MPYSGPQYAIHLVLLITLDRENLGTVKSQYSQYSQEELIPGDLYWASLVPGPRSLLECKTEPRSQSTCDHTQQLEVDEVCKKINI